jgi:hypothetical protein
LVVIAALSTVCPASEAAEPTCRLLCAPSLKVEPTLTFSNLFGGARIQSAGAAATREPGEREFEIILALDVPTRLKRLSFTAEAIWTPFGKSSRNPFTGRSAGELGVSSIRDNVVELEFEANFKWLTAERTGGWVSSHFDVVDKYSPAERPRDRSAYTHKLNLELDTAVSIFRWMPENHWLRRLEIEGSLDYVATGLPRAGDELSAGEILLDDASRWSFSLVLVIPLTP